MASINNAKKIVIEEATCLANKLHDGDSNCTETQGKAIALIVKMVTPLYEAEFVTIEECRKNHELLTKKNENGELTELAVGPMKIKGKIGRINFTMILVIMCMIGVVFAIGKTEGWW